MDRGEKPVRPFERAVAGLVLGGEDLVDRVRGLVQRIEDGRDPPSLSALRRSALPDPEPVEALVARIFAGELPRRKKRRMLYALRKHTALRPSEIAQRHLRSPAAVTLEL